VATVIGSASIRLTAEDAGLKEQINRDLNDAIKSSRITSDPLVAVQEQLRASELDLVKAQQQEATAEAQLARAEETVTKLRQTRDAQDKDLVAAELALYRAQLEMQSATDKVSQAERTAQAVEEVLAKATRDVAAAKAEASNRTSIFSKVLGGFRSTVNAVIHPITSTKNGVVSLGGALKDLGTKLVQLPVKAAGKLFDDFGTKAKNASKTLLSGAWSGFKKLITQSVMSPLTFAQGGFSGLGKLGSGVMSLLTNKIVLFGAGGAAAMGPLIGMMAALPGLALAGGAAIAVLKLGSDGLKKATAQLTPAFDKLKASVSAVFAKQLTPVFATLVPVIAAITPGLDSMATAISGVIKQLVGIVSSKAGIDQIKTALSGASQFIAAMGPGLASLLQMFLTLAATVAPQMKALGASIGSIFTAISGAFTQLASGPGVTNLQRIFSGLPGIFSGLASVIQPLIVILGQFAAQLAGPVGQVLSAIGQALTSAEGGLNSFGVAVGSALSALAEPLAAIGPLLGQLASLVGSVLGGAVRALEPALTTLIQGLSGALAPVLPKITQAFSALALALQPIANVLAKALVQVFSALAPMIAPLVQFVAQLAQMFGQLLTAAEPIIPPLLQLASALFPLLIQILQAAMPVLQAVVTGVSAIVPPLASLVGFISSVAVPIIQAFLPVVTTVFNAIGKIIGDVMNVIKSIIMVVLGVLTGNWRQAMDGIKGIVSGAWNLIKDIFSGAWNAIKSGVTAGLSAIVDFFRNLPGSILHVIGDIGSWLLQAGKDLIMGLVHGIENAAGAAWDAVKKGLGGLVSGAKHLLGIGSPSKVFASIGGFMMAGLTRGIVGSTQPVLNAASKAVGQIVGAFAPVADATVSTTVANALGEATAPRPNGSSARGAASSPQDMHDAIVSAISGWNVTLSAREAATQINQVNKTAGINR
jgi:phage-related protein